MARKPKTTSAAKSLQDALAFCSPAFKDIGSPYQCHVSINGKQVRAFDGVLAIGHPCEDELAVCPHGARLRAALDRPGALTLAVDQAGLRVTVGSFRALIPCLPTDDLEAPEPDPVAATGSFTALQEAFGALASIASNSGQSVVESSLLLEPMTVTATDRQVIMQAWHGVPLPKSFVLPRVFAQAVWKAGSPLTGLGASDNTFTAYFENGAWIRTQQYIEEWPNLTPVLGEMDNAGDDLPKDFFGAVDALMPFTNDTHTLTIHADKIEAEHAEQSIKTAVGKPVILNGRNLRHLAGRVERVNWSASERAVHFYGSLLRAAVIRGA